MSEELLIRHCSPTLAGIKTGNLFSCAYESKEQLMANISRLNKKLVPKGLRVLPLRMEQRRVLIYVYRPRALEQDLRDGRARAILERNGYPPEPPGRCLIRLMERLQGKNGFPHEIGLFLGYPPEDVQGFIEHKACGHKCAGCWKVYGDPEAARCTFERYERCSRDYDRQWRLGKSIERLTVAG